MTERLYLADPYLTRFRARVLEARELDGKPSALLDRSAFYPEGGGQPGDQGRLGEARVLDTQDRDGAVVHLLDRALATGTEVEGEVDWARRFDHLQQHHGQHLLSAAFVKVLGAPTVSFHLGEKLCTIDLDCSISKLDDRALRSAEAEANATVWRNLPVVARDFVGEERAKLTLRKEAVKGDRVVVVDGVDASPCGGTHPARTGDVGAIAVLRAQKWGAGQARVEFVCGGRVVRALGESQAALAAAAEAFRCSSAEVPEAAKRAAGEVAAKRKAVDALSGELAEFLAERLHAQSAPGPVMTKVERGATAARAVALALAAKGRVALVASVDEGRAHLCFARPKGAGPALNDLLREAVQALGGKGGGSPDMAQGSGDPSKLDEVLATARAKLG
jgi:alanyl-tRNA synthetase